MNVSWVSNTLKTGVFYFGGFLSLQYGPHPWKSAIIGMVRVWKATFQLTDPSYMNWLRRYSCLTGTTNFVVRHHQFRSSSLVLSSVGFLAYWAFHICELAFLAPILVQLHYFHLKWDSLNRFWTFSCSIWCMQRPQHISDPCDKKTCWLTRPTSLASSWWWREERGGRLCTAQCAASIWWAKARQPRASHPAQKFPGYFCIILEILVWQLMIEPFQLSESITTNLGVYKYQDTGEQFLPNEYIPDSSWMTSWFSSWAWSLVPSLLCCNVYNES